MLEGLIKQLEKKYDAEWVKLQDGEFHIWTIQQGKSSWKIIDYHTALEEYEQLENIKRIN